jgi:hypothetical protein
MKKAIIALCAVVLFLGFVQTGYSLTPQSPAKGQKIERFTGRVISVSLEDSSIVVQSAKAGMTFDVKGAKLKGYKMIANIKEGDRVTVQYVMHEGKATARTLTRK